MLECRYYDKKSGYVMAWYRFDHRRMVEDLVNAGVEFEQAIELVDWAELATAGENWDTDDFEMEICVVGEDAI